MQMHATYFILPFQYQTKLTDRNSALPLRQKKKRRNKSREDGKLWGLGMENE
jgi:hypothetical protein